MKAEFFGGLLLAVCVFGHESSSSCRYWCRSPEGQSFCCETDAQPISAPIAKPDYLGECPPVRPVCPATKFGPPKTCSSDGSCPGVEKCCYDRCLETTVCKNPIYPGGGTIGGPIGGGGLGGLIGGGGIGGPLGGGGHGRPIGGGGHGRPIEGGGHGRPIGGGGHGRPIGGGGHGRPIGGDGHGHSFGGGSIVGPIGGGSIGGPIGGGGIEGPIGGDGIGTSIGSGGQIQHRPGPDVDLTEFLRKGPKP